MREGREYKRVNRAQYAVSRRGEGGSNAGKSFYRFLAVFCILLGINILLMLRLQSQVIDMRNTLNRVLNMLSIEQQENEREPQSRQEGNNASNPIGQSTSRKKEVVDEPDYVSMCGLEKVDKPVDRTAAQVLQRLSELAEESESIKRIYQEGYRYPDRLLYALANNPEMADFAEHYLTAEPEPAGKGLTEAEKEQEYPLFLQWDPRWGYGEYGDDIIGLSGCGPTCLSMMLYYLTGDESLTPDKIADYSMKNGYYMAGVGTAWLLMEDIPVLYGVKVSQPGRSEQNMKTALDQGSIIICSVQPGDFTAGGHFIVIYGYDSEGFLVNDPNCVARSREKWPYEKLGIQIKNLWIYENNTVNYQVTTDDLVYDSL